MRVRALSATGDMTFGQGQTNFLVNSPAAVAQNVKTRLMLLTGEWFLNKSEGTPWATQVLGKYTQGLYDKVIQARILGTTGVTEIVDGSYSSSVNAATRALTVICKINTAYGTAAIEVTL